MRVHAREAAGSVGKRPTRLLSADTNDFMKSGGRSCHTQASLTTRVTHQMCGAGRQGGREEGRWRMVVSAADRFARALRVVFRGYVLCICGTGPSGRQGVVVEAPLPVLMNVRKEQGGEGEGREGRGGDGDTSTLTAISSAGACASASAVAIVSKPRICTATRHDSETAMHTRRGHSLRVTRHWVGGIEGWGDHQ